MVLTYTGGLYASLCVFMLKYVGLHALVSVLMDIDIEIHTYRVFHSFTHINDNTNEGMSVNTDLSTCVHCKL